MNDYISRQAAIDAIKNDASGLVYYGKKEAVECLDAVPAADVRLVAYGEPVKVFNDPCTGRMFTTCSQCAGKISPKDKFCKHCGADMRGKRA